MKLPYRGNQRLDNKFLKKIRSSRQKPVRNNVTRFRIAFSSVLQAPCAIHCALEPTHRPPRPRPRHRVRRQQPSSLCHRRQRAPAVSIALSTDMETPSSSTTTPSPLLGYLRPDPGPSSSKISHRPVDMAEAHERQQAVQKFLASAEMSKVCVSPRSTDWWIRRRVHSL